MKKVLFTFSILLLALCQIVKGQERDYHLDKDNMSFFKEAELVVEGRFLKPLCSYAVKDENGKEHYYGICPVITYHVFKGDAKAGDTIYVIREGLSLKEAIASPYDFRYHIDEHGIYQMEDVQYVAPAIASSKNISVTNHFLNDCIMFFKSSTYPVIQDERYSSLKQYQYLYPYVFYDEGTKLYVFEERFVKSKYAGLNDTIFNSRQDLYAFMRKAGGYDLSVIGSDTIKNDQSNSEKSRYPMIQVGPPSYPNGKNQKADCYPDKPLPPEVEKRWGSKKKIKPSKNNTDLYISFSAPQLQYNHSLNRVCVEVDLCVHTNRTNVFFDGGSICVVYDTTAFGTDIANTESFDVSFCSEFISDSYWLISSTNVTPNTLSVFGAFMPVPNMQRVELDTNPKPFLHLSFVVDLDSAESEIYFQTVNTKDYSLMYSDSATAPTDIHIYFDHIFHLSSDTIRLPNNHTPVILSKDSTTKFAGIGDTLSIRGINFGNTKGEVFFKAADNGGQSYLRGLDDQYHLYWSDTLIQVLVPSLVYKGYETIIDHNWSDGAGTGYVKIQTANGYTNINNVVNFVSINYSVLNTKMNNTIKRIYLARQQCNFDYQFTLHRSLENDSSKIFVIDTALRLWSNLTGLKLQLERDANGHLVFENSNNVEGKNLILKDSLSSGVLMNTTRACDYAICNNGTDTILYRSSGSNIRISRQYEDSLNYNLSGYIYNQFSFYQAFVHEIGHFLLLGHINDIGNIMYYQLKKNIPIIVPDSSSWAVKGVLANIEASRNINWPSNSGLYPIGARQPKITVANSQTPVLCDGSSLTLQSNYPTEPHLWSTGETTQSITVQNGGIYTLSISDGACTLSDTIQIDNSVLQANLVTTPTTCPNGTDGSITAQVTGNYPPFSYQWSGNGITPANTPQINDLTTGTYYLTLTDSVGCQLQFTDSIVSAAGVLHVEFFPYGPVSPFDTTSNPLLDTLSCRKLVAANTSGGKLPLQYKWYYSNMGETSPSQSSRPISTTFYACGVNIPIQKSLYLWVRDACGQSVLKELPWNEFRSMDSSDDNAWNVKLSPNPANNQIDIHSDNSGLIKQVQVYDVCGKLIQTLDVNSPSKQIDISNLAAGMYFIRAISENEAKTISFVKR